MAKKSSNIIRAEFPKIRIVTVKGEPFYQVDARRQGTTGKRETFTLLAKAEKRAGEIAGEVKKHGVEALSISSELRNMAMKWHKILSSYGKTLDDAGNHYEAYLKEQAAAADSKTIEVLADEWHAAKSTGSNRKLKDATVTNIKLHADLLKKEWPNKHLLDFKSSDMQRYLDDCQLSQRTKFNIRSRTSQFFNWCISKEYMKVNPVENIEITVPRTTIHVLSPDAAQHHLTVCQEKHPEYTLYVAVSLFAGLRPTECQLLQWENIHIEEAQITVLDHTSKIAETRNVPIEDNLLAFFNAYKGERKGFVTRQTNFSNKIKKIRADMGYKVNGKNEEGQVWPEDVYRHSYGSYWLAKNKDRAHLAENMGNSIEVIKRHYKTIVSNSAQEAYWKISPGFDITTAPVDIEKETSERRIKSILKALAE